MKRGFVLGALVVAGALLTSVGAARQTPSVASIQVDKVRDNLYVLRGGGGNTAAFITAKGVALVDTKLPGWGKPMLEKLKEITDKPVTMIINTHTHFDHVGGNVEFPATVEVVTHENTAKLMQEMRPVTGGPEQPNVFKEKNGIGLPKRTFKDRMTLGSGDERIELYYFGRAHTGGDAWVVFPALRALHTGDAFALKNFPLIDANNGGSGVEYPKTIAKAAAALKNIDTIITGHNPTTLTIADLKTYSDDMRRFVRSDSFSLVLNMFTSFGYFDDKEDDLKVLRNAYQSLKPEGAILIELLGKELLARRYQATISTVEEDSMNELSQVAPAFIEMAHRIVWCSAATVDVKGRPRSRILHPYWQWDGTRLVGWIGTSPTSLKRAHLNASPYMSLNYWTPSQDTCVAECRATWAFDDETRIMAWNLFLNEPEPLGYNPAIIPGWDSPTSDAFAAIRLAPWRLKVFPGSVLMGQGGETLTWRG